MSSHENHKTTHIADYNAAIVDPPAASSTIAGIQAHAQAHRAGLLTAFTTTDASGYPDKHDGLSAHNTTHNSVILNQHEHHKHTQVQDPELAAITSPKHEHGYGHE
ncbi:hypothetical protein BX616_003634 [Lobosporangium transversale]|uniref:Uncharacterized protein n=1 Tax=Lobosporangium transversale TaxID=64571 RepID=A0A1Y2H4J9_9FUNG|nr:hypothetical protein BCR41DRAFT_392430 [Lobosporangium transversale]KAF9898769.1 hypothetical protein BX616_003634 [Lobosporangium transversale]ORZ27972.1 hypothetical protein BCR41DRAFT_392430 [Lobosporangium transversale]|eukprot:XP_021885675.1 hypothetical protein BCR41DRAFT_392430 [Lobosporangium transversale]